MEKVLINSKTKTFTLANMSLDCQMDKVSINGNLVHRTLEIFCKVGNTGVGNGRKTIKK